MKRQAKQPRDERELMHMALSTRLGLRGAGLEEPRPLEEEDLPEWVISILRVALAQFDRSYPDDLPPPPERQKIFASYHRRIEKLYHDELAARFDLESPR